MKLDDTAFRLYFSGVLMGILMGVLIAAFLLVTGCGQSVCEARGGHFEKMNCHTVMRYERSDEIGRQYCFDYPGRCYSWRVHQECDERCVP